MVGNLYRLVYQAAQTRNLLDLCRFFLPKTLAGIVYQGNRLILPGGSKISSVKNDFFWKNRTGNLSFFGITGKTTISVPLIPFVFEPYEIFLFSICEIETTE